MIPGSSVVVADPSNFIRGELCGGFALRGFAVHGLEDGRSARRFVASTSPALLVTELRLADGPSVGLIEWVKRNRCDTRVVVLTDHGSVAGAIKCMRLRTDCFLTKPAGVDRILCEIEGRGGDAEDLPGRPSSLDRALWEYINQATTSAGSIGEAARRLGVDRRSLRRMLAKAAPPTMK